MSDLDELRDLTRASFDRAADEGSASIIAVHRLRIVATYQATVNRGRSGVRWKLRPNRALSGAIGYPVPEDGNLDRFVGRPRSKKHWMRQVAGVAIDHVRASEWSPSVRQVDDAAGYVAAERSWRRSVDKRYNYVLGGALVLFALPSVGHFLTGRPPRPPDEGSGDAALATLGYLGQMAHFMFLEAPILSTIESPNVPEFIVGVVGVVAALAIALAVRPRTVGMDVAALVQQLRWTTWAGWTISGVSAVGLAMALHLVVAKPGDLISWATLLLTVAGAVAASVSAEGALDLALTNSNLIAARRRALANRRNRIIAALKNEPTRRQILLGMASHVGIATCPFLSWVGVRIVFGDLTPDWGILGGILGVFLFVGVIYVGAFLVAYLMGLAMWHYLGTGRLSDAHSMRLMGLLLLLLYASLWLSISPLNDDWWYLLLVVPACLLPGLTFTPLRGLLNPGITSGWRVVKQLQKRIERQYDDAVALNRPDASVF